MKKAIKEQLQSLTKLDMICVEWVDAEKDEGTCWVDLDSAVPDKQQYVTARAIGFFVGFSPTLLRMTSDYDPSNNKIYGFNDIQTANIKTIEKLYGKPRI